MTRTNPADLAATGSPARSGTAPAAGAIVGRLVPRIMRCADPSAAAWPAALGRAATLGFDTLLLPAGEVPTKLVEAARGLNVSLLVDLPLDRAPTASLGAVPGPFTLLQTPSLDPRQAPALADEAPAAVATAEDAGALAAWFIPAIKQVCAGGVAGVRLVGLERLPGWALPTVLQAVRAGCPGCLLLGWAPDLSWATLDAVPAGSLDLVGASLAVWDGAGDRLWRALDKMRRIGPVVVEAGEEAGRQGLAAVAAEGWMTTDRAEAETLNRLRMGLSGLPWARLVSPGGGPAYAVLRTDTPDPRRATRAAVAVTAVSACEAPSGLIRPLLEADFHPFVSASGQPMGPVRLDAGGLQVFAARARAGAEPTSLSRKRAEAAGERPRVAIEAPSPCVEGGLFPARIVVGNDVVVEADVIADGHDKLAAVIRWQVPGREEWQEAPMRLRDNDRWTARFPLQQLGLHQYVIEAWKDEYATYVDELEKKHAAGVPIGLELQEGALLIRAALSRGRKGVQAALAPVLQVLDAEGPDAQRAALLAPETQAAMARADARPHRVTTDSIPVQAERTGAGFASWYEVFPRSMSDDPARHGTFRDVERHLPRIQAMGFDVLYFPPFHPIGRINRKGPNNTLTPGPNDPGSPYAIGSTEGGHDALHPELGTIEDLQHLVQAAAAHGIELAMDFAVQCAPDHPWLKQHKGWFDWRPDGSIRYAENPPKKYQDIVNVDFYAKDAIPELWLALAETVLFWAGQGIRLFRVDNPHTKPLPFWHWMITEVQARYPDAVFLAEAFTRPKVMYRLAKVGFSQSYSYFTWRNTKAEFEAYLTELQAPPVSQFFRPHFFVNTPDINPVPLQTAPRQGFLIRTALASLLSGRWGLYNGFELCDATPLPGREEYLDSEKYQIRAWDWDRPGNIVAEIGALNAIRRRNPALQTHLGVTFLRAENDQVLLFEKATPDRGNVVLVAINMDLHQPQGSPIEIPFWRWTEQPDALIATDLLHDRQERWTDRTRFVRLTAEQPYAIWRLAPEAAEGTR